MTESSPAITRVAAFDVDGTLTLHDCVVPFLRRIAGVRRLAWGLLRHSPTVVGAALRRDRDALKAASAMAAFRGEELARVEAEAEGFARSVFEHDLRPEALAALRAHQEAGDTVLLVSASFEVYLRPLAALLDLDDVLAVRLDVDAHDRLSGRLSGPNCRGPEKVRRLHAWLGEYAGGRDAVHVTAYGDSRGDREMLADADVARWMGRGEMPR